MNKKVIIVVVMGMVCGLTHAASSIGATVRKGLGEAETAISKTAGKVKSAAGDAWGSAKKGIGSAKDSAKARLDALKAKYKKPQKPEEIEMQEVTEFGSKQEVIGQPFKPVKESTSEYLASKARKVKDYLHEKVKQTKDFFKKKNESPKQENMDNLLNKALMD